MKPFANSLYVGTFSGRKVTLDVVDPQSIEIIDIAVGLANQCRYAGQVWPFYSVAEHSIVVSELVTDDNQRRSRKLKALMHDAPEYILNDITRPVKRQIYNYDYLETKVMTAICSKYEMAYSKDDWERIKDADNMITITERIQLMPRLNRGDYGVGTKEEDVPKIKFKCMTPPRAALAFLDRFWELSHSYPTREQTKLIDIIREAA